MYNLKRMYKHKYRTLPVLHCELSLFYIIRAAAVHLSTDNILGGFRSAAAYRQENFQHVHFLAGCPGFGGRLTASRQHRKARTIDVRFRTKWGWDCWLSLIAFVSTTSGRLAFVTRLPQKYMFYGNYRISHTSRTTTLR